MKEVLIIWIKINKLKLMVHKSTSLYLLLSNVLEPLTKEKAILLSEAVN